MTADIIQFVPKANTERATLLETKEMEAAEFLQRAPALAVGQFAPSHFVADEKDSA